MSNKQGNVDRLESHSLAKVSLYLEYLKAYLSILGNAKFSKVYLYDLFAGEGKYGNDYGSSIGAYLTIHEYLKRFPNFNTKIELRLNEIGTSQYEAIPKISRIKKEIENLGLSSNLLSIIYSSEEFSNLTGKLISECNRLKSDERGLILLDPWGYKDTQPNLLKSLLENQKTEILLFLPIDFIYRFAKKTLSDEEYAFASGRHIKEFLEELNIQSEELQDGIFYFIQLIKNKFLNKSISKYVDYFMLTTQSNNTYTLFFFTNNKLGYKKMIDTKWKVDPEEGSSFDFDKYATKSLFSSFRRIDFLEEELKKYISEFKSNIDIHDFTYDLGFRTTHSSKILKKLETENKIDIISKPNINRRKGSFYLDENDSKIQVKLKGDN